MDLLCCLIAKSFEIHPASDRSRKPNCDAPDTSRGQLLLNVSIVGCNIADSSWNARNCTKYKVMYYASIDQAQKSFKIFIQV